MYWLGIVALVLGMAFIRYKTAKRAGLWSWSKFFLTIGFILGVCAIVSAPLVLMNMNSPYFWWVYGAGWAVAVALFVWFIVKARKWKFPGAPPTLEADRDQPTPPR